MTDKHTPDSRERRDAASVQESDWYDRLNQLAAWRIYAEQVVQLGERTERDLAESVLELIGEVERLRSTVKRAAGIALSLHSMIDRETWRSTGGDDQQGHYEGDYHAEQVAREIRSWTK